MSTSPQPCTSEMSTKFGPVDLVYLWCDGADPNFVARKNARMAEFRPPEIEENIGDVRYIQFDELKYSLRSAFMYAPWLRHIFIITDSQVPTWLGAHPKVTIVDHKDIIPKKLLPTFSAICIEMFLHRIPGLSEHFLLANDDTFFHRSVTPHDFFTEEGKPIVNLSRNEAKSMTESLAHNILNDDSKKDWHKSLVRAWILHRQKRNNEMPFYTPHHSIDAYKKSFYSQTIESYPELLEANASPFRTGDEITRILFSYEMISTFNCPAVFNPKPDVFARIRSRLFSIEMSSVCRTNVGKMKRDLKVFNPKTFCLNNLSPEAKKESFDFFESHFPMPAPWEK